MRPSSNWRKKNADATVDIFGNKKRGGGGDPIGRSRTNGLIIPNIPAINNNKYKLLPQNVNPPTSMAPHLRSSMGQFSAANRSHSHTKKLSDELFRQELDEQIAAQKQQKILQRLQEMEQEKKSQQKLENEFQELRTKYVKEMNTESNVSAGFLRYKNSHSHIPPGPATNSHINDKLFEEVQEIKETENENEHEIEYKKCIQTTNVIPDNLKTLEMQLLQEKLAWKHKMSEQELELKRLKLQMLEQQNDQKTTLQYLLKLQTDFTQQIHNNNKNNNINIRRSIQSSPTPQTPPNPQTLLLSQMQNNNKLLQQMQHSLSYKQQQPIQYTQHTQHHTPQISPPLQQHQISPQISSYFPMQQISPPLTQQRQSPIQYIEEAESQQTQYPIQYIEEPEAEREQKQESFLCNDSMHGKEYGVLLNNESSFLVFSESDAETEAIDKGKQLNSLTVFELSSRPTTAIPAPPTKKKSFLVFDGSESDTETEANKDTQLNSSTLFELSTRPTTAIRTPPKQKKSVSPTGSYSSFGGNDGNKNKNNDAFTIHVAVDEDDEDVVVVDNKWKQISDVDRNNVESLRDALDEISNEDNAITETIENKIPIKTPTSSMSQEMFVVKYIESKEDGDENETDYEQDFENEWEIQLQPTEEKEKDVLRLPELDASINNFESKVYSVYSSFDESLITNSVASSSDYSNKSPHKMTCKTITE